MAHSSRLSYRGQGAFLPPPLGPGTRLRRDAYVNVIQVFHIGTGIDGSTVTRLNVGDVQTHWSTLCSRERFESLTVYQEGSLHHVGKRDTR